MSDITGDLSIISLIAHADFVVQIIMLILLAASIFSWGVILEKSLNLRRQSKRAEKFEKSSWSKQSLERISNNFKAQKNNIIIDVISTGVKRFNSLDNSDSKDLSVSQETRTKVEQAMWFEYKKFMCKLERNVDTLATIGSTAPFVGLLGTVWGIMHSFQAIALSNNTSLATVAPSIAEALLATAAGLLVSIPAVVFYNRITIKSQNFSDRLINCIAKIENVLFQETDNQ